MFLFSSKDTFVGMSYLRSKQDRIKNTKVSVGIIGGEVEKLRMLLNHGVSWSFKIWMDGQGLGNYMIGKLVAWSFEEEVC